MGIRITSAALAITMICWSSSAIAMLTCDYRGYPKKLSLHEQPEGPAIRFLQSESVEYSCDGEISSKTLPLICLNSKGEQLYPESWYRVFEDGKYAGFTKLDPTQIHCSGGF
jgi:hypothetical protein